MASGQYKTYMTVSQDGSGDYNSIQSAIDDTKSFPDKPITIFIKNGTYNEKVTVHSWNTNLTLLGESKDGVIITWDDHFKKTDKGRNSTFHTYTMKVDANDFTAKNLTIINSAGPVGQAVALSVEADRCSFIYCNIQGNQDTAFLSGEGNRQYFKGCFISGTTDYIFGNASVLFDSCEIKSLSNSYITAASTEQSSKYGFVFIKCSLTASENVSQVYLGRPWRPFAKTVFIECQLGAHITPEGWKEWSNADNKETTFYAEYNCEGKGNNPQSRIAWSHQLSKKQAKKYNLNSIFGDWCPNQK